DAPTLGILGRLGGIGARPEVIGFVSDGDGALVAIAVAAKLLDYKRKNNISSKIGVFHQDFEAQYSLTTEYVEKVFEDNIED
ncbi:DUF1177 family protein, partial [Clostridioides difficile]|uniref:DUF1177 family protein n=1 Tax=Clostridioides difficile TaxID=1496 RepID=UPI0020B2A475